MAEEIELEITYLAKELPKGLESYKSKEILDIYIPSSTKHPTLRVRKDGARYMITKKQPIDESDASRQLEQTIPLSEEEFNDFDRLQGKRVRKERYLYPYEGRTAEIDVFRDGLEGLVLVDFEFNTVEEKDSFKMPGFCLVDVTQEDFVAGGMLCGKKYSDIEKQLQAFGYSKILK